MKAERFIWTEKETAKLKTMVRAGASYSEIGQEFRCTRNQVAGKLFRMRLAESKPAPTKAAPVRRRMARYRFKRHKINPQSLPIIQELFKGMNEQLCTLNIMAERSGVARSTLLLWQNRGNPNYSMLECCFEVLGKRFVIEDIEE